MQTFKAFTNNCIYKFRNKEGQPAIPVSTWWSPRIGIGKAVSPSYSRLQRSEIADHLLTGASASIHMKDSGQREIMFNQASLGICEKTAIHAFSHYKLGAGNPYYISIKRLNPITFERSSPGRVLGLGDAVLYGNRVKDLRDKRGLEARIKEDSFGVQRRLQLNDVSMMATFSKVAPSLCLGILLWWMLFPDGTKDFMLDCVNQHQQMSVEHTEIVKNAPNEGFINANEEFTETREGTRRGHALAAALGIAILCIGLSSPELAGIASQIGLRGNP